MTTTDRVKGTTNMTLRQKALVVAAVLAVTFGACGDTGNGVEQEAMAEAGATTQAPDVTTTRVTTTTMPASSTVDELAVPDADESEGATDSHDGAMGHDEESTEKPTNGHDDEAGDATSGERLVHVVMTEFAFDPETIEVASGETVRFVVANSGVIAHEFRLSNPHRIEEHIAAGHQHHDSGGHHSEDGDVFVEVEAGEIGELVVTFPESTTVYTMIACLLPGHYEAGMLGQINHHAT